MKHVFPIFLKPRGLHVISEADEAAETPDPFVFIEVGGGLVQSMMTAPWNGVSNIGLTFPFFPRFFFDPFFSGATRNFVAKVVETLVIPLEK